MSNLAAKQPSVYAEVEYFADFEGTRKLRMPDGSYTRTVHLLEAKEDEICKEYIEDLICKL